MKTNKNTLIIILCILFLMIGAVVILQPKGRHSLNPFLTDTVVKGKVLVYFSKNKGSEIVTEPVIRKLPATRSKTEKERLVFTITELLKGPAEQEKEAGYFSEIPPGTNLISINEDNKGFYIDLSKEYTFGGGSNSMVQRLHEVTRTVISTAAKKPVYLTVEGKSLQTLGGEGIMVHEPITEDPSVKQ